MGQIKKIGLLLIGCCWLACVHAATIDSTIQLQLIKSIPGSYTNVWVDNLGNVYLLSNTNQIKKINNHFDSVAQYNDVKRYGNIGAMDVSNPLKILVYYTNFATIVVLDRFLNNRNTIDLRQQNILQVKAICQSYDNNIWLFDEVDSKLKKIDDNGNLVLESVDFRLLFDETTTPNNIIDMNGNLYLYHAKTGWKIFDYYGAFKKQYAILGWRDVQVTDHFLLGRDSAHFFSANPQQLQFTTSRVSVGLENALKVIRQQSICYILYNDKLEIYREP